jgi:hypothetical protein
VTGDLPKLLNAGIDSCIRLETASTTSGPVLDEIPLSGTLYWYLTIGARGPVNGSAGEASAGSRIVDAAGTCP